MQAELFYTTEKKQAIPLYCISAKQWEEGVAGISDAERNGFLQRQFQGKMGDCCMLTDADGLISRAYIGSGEGSQSQALAQAALQLVPGNYQVHGGVSAQAALHWSLAQYRFDRYKKCQVKPRVLVVEPGDLSEVLALSQAIYLVRDLINRPTNDLGPEELALVAEQLAQTHKAQCKQWIGDELLNNNFPAIHAVGRASASAPRLVSLTWGDEKHPRVTLIGKGVCFDSGGLDIKPSSNMRLMKKDMGGAAHVLGLAQWIMTQRLPVRLQVLIPAVENAIGPNAFRPGDILTMRNGLTVEIDNTDAEGRLVLADALVKACEDKPELLIDFATLTGAARVALGTDVAAVFSNNDALYAELAKVSAATADPVWRLPLVAEYEELLNSSCADIVNSSASPYAGAIVAGLFLQRFIADKTPWLHFDIMAWNTGSKPGKPEGGEALGFRAIAALLKARYTLN